MVNFCCWSNINNMEPGNKLKHERSMTKKTYPLSVGIFKKIRKKERNRSIERDKMGRKSIRISGIFMHYHKRTRWTAAVQHKICSRENTHTHAWHAINCIISVEKTY